MSKARIMVNAILSNNQGRVTNTWLSNRENGCVKVNFQYNDDVDSKHWVLIKEPEHDVVMFQGSDCRWRALPTDESDTDLLEAIEPISFFLTFNREEKTPIEHVRDVVRMFGG
jgi:hypothetical protein